MSLMDGRVGTLVAWLAAFGAVAAVVGWETDWGRQVRRLPEVSAPPAPAPQQVALLPDYEGAGGVAARRDTVERPAFVPTRRPAPSPVPEVPKPKIQRGQFQLTGTAVVDQKAIAFLRESAGGKARTVRAGETINGMMVAEVRPDRVRLTLGDESEELVLKVAAGPRTTVQPAAPVPPAAQPGVGGNVPVVPQVPGAAAAPAPMDSDQSILERRRAARAAQAAADAAARGSAPVAPAAVPATPVPQSGPMHVEQPPASNPQWAEIYQRRSGVPRQ